MSRSYMNDKWCVRCGKTTPTPFLEKNMFLFKGVPKEGLVVDIGCGNGRNSVYMKQQGFLSVLPCDMKPDYGCKMHLGHDKFKVHPGEACIILANYVLMFLNKKERLQVYKEMHRMSHHGTYIVVEYYPALDSFAKTKEDIIKLRDEFLDFFSCNGGFRGIRMRQDKLIILAGAAL